MFSYEFRGKFSNLTAGLATAGKGVEDFGGKLVTLDKRGAKMRQSLTAIGDGAGKMGLVAAGGLALITAATTNFEQAMSRVDAATHATGKEMESLRQAALDAGADTAFSASEAAGAIEELAKAGMSTEHILSGGLSGALNLAAAGTISVAEAAEITATTLNQYGLSGANATRVSDVLAASAGKAQGEVTDMAQALKYVGPVAAQMGLSLEETSGSIAYLASQGILGEQAGTALRGMLTSLTSPSKVARDEMDRLGISMYDAQGEFIGLDGLAGQLQGSLGKLNTAQRDEALGRIFGNEQITAARILYAGGSEAIEEWTGKVDDSGYAADTAARKMDNLAGDLEYLKGSLETLAIGMGEDGQGPLRGLVQGLDDTVNAVNELPGPVKTATVAGLALTAVFGGGTWFTARTISGLTTTRDALTQLGVSADTATKSTKILGRGLGAAAGLGAFMVGVQNTNETLGAFEAAAGGAAAGLAVGGPWGAAIGGAIGLVVALGTSNEDTASQVRDLTATFDAQTGAITENTRTKVNAQAQEAGLLDAAERLGLQASVVTDAILGNAAAQDTLNAAIDDYDADYTITSVENLRKAYSEQEVQAILSARAATTLRDEVPGLTTNFQDAAEQAEQFARGMEETAAASGQAGGAALMSAEEIKAQAKALEDARNEARGTAEQFFNLSDSLDDSKASLGDWIKDMQEAADDLRHFRVNAEKAADNGVRKGLIAALEEAGPAGARRLRQLANATEEEVGKANRAWGRGQREIQKYVDLKVPTKTVDVNINPALDATGRIRAELASLSDRELTVWVTERHRDAAAASRGPGVVGTSPKRQKKASGGQVLGPGGPRDDLIPAMLSNREYVMPVDAVDYYGLDFMEGVRAKRLAGGGSANGKRGSRSIAVWDLDLDSLKGSLKDLERDLRFSQKALAAETKQRDQLIQERDQIRSSVASGLSTDIWGPSNPWTSNSAADPTGKAKAVAATAEEFADHIRSLSSKGLDGPALAEVIASGDINRARLMDSLPASSLAAFENAINRRDTALAAAGVAATGALGVDAALASSEESIKQLKQMNRDQERAAKRLEKTIDRIADRTAKQITRGVNGAGAQGAKNKPRGGR